FVAGRGRVFARLSRIYLGHVRIRDRWIRIIAGSIYGIEQRHRHQHAAAPVQAVKATARALRRSAKEYPPWHVDSSRDPPARKHAGGRTARSAVKCGP